MKIQYLVAGLCVGALVIHFTSKNPAHADNSRCNVSTSKTFPLTIEQAQRLQIGIGPDKLDLRGRRGDDGELKVRFCASDDARLDAMGADLTVVEGVATLELDHGGQSNRTSGGWFSRRKSSYSYFEVKGDLSALFAVDASVGSGSGKINGFAEANAIVGSGTMTVEDIAGPVSLTVGSGKATLRHLGRFDIGAIGSGNVDAERIRGGASIGSIGSGSAKLADIEGEVNVGTIGSGSFRADNVNNSVTVGSVGSGGVVVRNVSGDFTLRSKGSGSVSHDRVSGKVTVPNR
ncbi:hypothetical protein [Aliidiomarina indica]|uniref:hypothetical protein n=1 Tax=Aliidiomarina indica TaxID=2749147 RepID=UPI00188DD15F|nr:hypothetical protein [Aliidiomarina indica]